MLKAAIFVFVLSFNSYASSQKVCYPLDLKFKAHSVQELMNLKLSFDSEKRDFISFKWASSFHQKAGKLVRLSLPAQGLEFDSSFPIFVKGMDKKWVPVQGEFKVTAGQLFFDTEAMGTEIKKREFQQLEVIVPVSELPKKLSGFELCETVKY